MSDLEVLILGPVEARADGAPLVLRRRKQRALLAILACERGRVLSLEHIIDELWGERPPLSARHSVEVYASSLRRLVGRDRIERGGDGYRLHLDPEALDAERFAALVERARHARPPRARRLLEEALSLVRGEPLAEFSDVPFALAERDRLAELVLAAREGLVDARLALGEQEGLVGELRARCAEQPTRERPRAQLMLALYRAGRQEDALAVYRAASRALRDILGVEPGPGLRELERRILRHDPTLVALADSRPPRSNAPAPMHPLIGRARELAEISSLLRSEARLVTLTGTGGVGKTRLAIALAAELACEFADGVVFVSLAAVRDPGSILSAIARACEVQDGGEEHPSEALRNRLRQREVLLVLDNLEHLLDATPALSALLAGCAELRLLATSRSPLGLYGEHVYVLQPLAVPGRDSDAGDIAAAPAGALFAARARAARPGFRITIDNANAVGEICRRLDGLPLAIELAASQTRVVSPQILLERLRSRLEAGEGPRDAPERQRTVRAAIAWSYDLLTPAQQALFRRIGIFRGGATADAIGVVCDETAGSTIDTGLRTLVEHNLVRRVDHERYEQLETIREYAVEKLREEGELERFRVRHACHFVELMEAAEPELYGAQPPDLLRRLGAEYANLIAAVEYAAEAERPDLELRLLGAAVYLFVLRGWLAEARRLTESALARSKEQPVRLRARCAMAAAALSLFEGRYDKAVRHANDALQLGEQAGDRFVRFKALDVLAYTAWEQGQVERAQATWRQAVVVARAASSPFALGTALYNLGWSLLDSGDHDGAEALLEASGRSFSAIGNRDGIAFTHHALAILAGVRGRTADATRYFESAFEHGSGLNSGLVFGSMPHLAELALDFGNPRAAARLLGLLEQRSAATDRVMDVMENQACQRVRQRISCQLEASEIEHARTEGAAVPHEEAADYALSILRSCKKQADP